MSTKRADNRRARKFRRKMANGQPVDVAMYKKVVTTHSMNSLRSRTRNTSGINHAFAAAV